MVRHQFAVGRRAGLLALVAFTTACSDRSLPSGPSLSPGMVGRLLTCAADVRAQTLSCTAPGVGGGSGKLSADLVLSGQGIYVALRSSAVSYDGTSTFQANVTVQNLTAVPLGTADGTTVTGVKVFFSSGPSLVSGTGTVSGTTQVLYGVWGSGRKDVFAVGTGGTILHYDGTSWTVQPSGTPQVLYGVWGSRGTDVFAVGDGGTILHYNGTSWTVQPSGTSAYLNGVWGTGGTDVFAVGEGGTILHYDGTSWTVQPNGMPQVLYGVWGSGGTDVFAVGE